MRTPTKTSDIKYTKQKLNHTNFTKPCSTNISSDDDVTDLIISGITISRNTKKKPSRKIARKNN